MEYSSVGGAGLAVGHPSKGHTGETEGPGEAGSSSNNGSRRSSATGAALGSAGGKRVSGGPSNEGRSTGGATLMPGGVRKGSFVDPKSLPIITEKSDTQSVVTEASLRR